MVTITYILKDCAETIRAITNLCMRIPSFVDTDYINPSKFKFTIRCRIEDEKAVDSAIARYAYQKNNTILSCFI